MGNRQGRRGGARGGGGNAAVYQPPTAGQQRNQQQYLYGGQEPIRMQRAPQQQQAADGQQVSKQTTYTFRNPFHVQKDTVRVIPCGEGERRGTHRVEFLFSAGEPCVLTLAMSFDGAAAPPASLSLPPSLSLPFGMGDGQQFQQDQLLLDTSGAQLSAPVDILLQISMRGQGEHAAHEFWTHCRLRLQPGSGGCRASCTVVKQEVRIQGESFPLQDIYGIADGAAGAKGDAGGPECVICMTEQRNTAVLPCRHMCLCSTCAADLRVRSNKCPICRQPAESYLEIDVSA
eukprot:g911.t1